MEIGKTDEEIVREWLDVFNVGALKPAPPPRGVGTIPLWAALGVTGGLAPGGR